jgi:hypothetical protein
MMGGLRRQGRLAAAAIVALAGASSAEPNAYRPQDAVAMARHRSHETVMWQVTIWKDGTIEYYNERAITKSGRTRLSIGALNGFLSVLDRERPWEIAGYFGELPVHGPLRTVQVNVNGVRSEFRLYTTPKGFEHLYKTDETGLGRALRFCEAIRALIRDEGLPRCVDRVAP